MANPVTWFEVMAGPGGRTELREFYSATFGWAYDEVEGGYAMVRQPEGESGIGGGLDESPDGAKVVISIEVDDLPAYVEKIKANGGEIVQDITVVPGMVTYATFRDPAGNVLGVVAAEIPPAQ